MITFIQAGDANSRTLTLQLLQKGLFQREPKHDIGQHLHS